MATIFPLSASVGQQFQDYAFDGESWNIIGENWKPFTYSATEPDFHEAGFIWVDSNEVIDEISYVSASGYQILTNKVMDGDYNYFSNIPELATLPSQNGNAGKYLTTSGSVSSWGILDTKLVKYGSSAPPDPEEGTIWIDSTNIVKPVTKVYNGSNWIIASGQAEATIHPFFLAGT